MPPRLRLVTKEAPTSRATSGPKPWPATSIHLLCLAASDLAICLTSSAGGLWRFSLDDARVHDSGAASFMTRYLSWYFTVVYLILSNRWLTLFIAYHRAKSLSRLRTKVIRS